MGLVVIITFVLRGHYIYHIYYTLCIYRRDGNRNKINVEASSKPDLLPAAVLSEARVRPFQVVVVGRVLKNGLTCRTNTREACSATTVSTYSRRYGGMG